MAYTRRIAPRSKPRPGRLKGAALQVLRLACFERDEGRCSECDVPLIYSPATPFVSNGYHMAHIGAKRRHGDSLDNVRALCGSCHHREHNPKSVPPKTENRREEENA